MASKLGKLYYEIGADASDFNRGMKSVENAMSDIQRQTANFVGRLDGSYSSISKKASDSAKAMERAFAKQRESMQYMIDVADPLGAALRRVAQAEVQANTALAAGTITAQEHALIMANLTKIAGATGRGFANSGMLIQQAGYQVADVAAVAAAGGNAFAAVGTQLGQFLGFMGPWGAVIGAGVTIMGLFVTSLLKAGDASSDAKDEADRYERALNALVDIEKEYNDVLRERAGLPKLNGNLKTLQQNAVQANYAAEDTSDSLSFFGGAWSLLKQKFGGKRTKTAAEDARAKAEFAQSDYGYAAELDAGTQENKLKTVLETINDERAREISLMKISADQRDRAQAMVDAELSMRKALKDTVATPDEVDAEVKKARDQAAATYDQKKAEESLARTQEDARRAAEKARQESEKQVKVRQEMTASVDQEISDNNRLIAALKVSEEEYRRVSALIQEEKKFRQAKVDMTPDDQAKAEQIAQQNNLIDEQKEKYESLNKLGSDLGMTFSSAFEDAIVEGKKFSEILDSLYQDILRLMIRSQITQPLASSAGSLFGNMFKSIWGSLPGFASGTRSAPSGMAWVGEEGPELMKFKGGEQIYPAALSRKIAAAYAVPGYADGVYNMPIADGGTNGKMNVNIINNSGADISTQQRTVGGVETLEVLVDKSVGKMVGRRGSNSSKALRQTYGAQERLISR